LVALISDINEISANITSSPSTPHSHILGDNPEVDEDWPITTANNNIWQAQPSTNKVQTPVNNKVWQAEPSTSKVQTPVKKLRFDLPTPDPIVNIPIATSIHIPICINKPRPQELPSDLNLLLGPTYTVTVENLKAPPNNITTIPNVKNLITLPNNSVNQATPDLPSDLEALLGPSFIQAYNHSYKTNKTIKNAPPMAHSKIAGTTLPTPAISTNNNENVDLDTLLGSKFIEASANTNEQPLTSNINTTNSDILLLSLQNRVDIIESALLPWRQARSFLSAQAKAECRSQHLERLRNNSLTPPWSLGLEALPGFLHREAREMTDLRRHHALELIQRAKELLASRARQYSNTGRAALMTCEILYGEDSAGWNRAKDLLAQLVGGDKSKCLIALNKRLEQAANKPPTDDDVLNALLEGTKTTQTTRNPQNPRPRPRSRSRSPRGRGRGNSQQRSSSRSRPGTSTRPKADSNTDRQPKDNRGRAKNLGGNRSRSNRPNQQQPRQGSQQGPRSGASRPNSNSYNNPPGASNTRRNLNLTDAELALIKAFRSKND
jgi:hypothetical protein